MKLTVKEKETVLAYMLKKKKHVIKRILREMILAGVTEAKEIIEETKEAKAKAKKEIDNK